MTTSGVSADYLRQAAGLLSAIKQDSHKDLRIGPRQRALDVGCGPGLDTTALARAVGPDAMIVGVDADPDMVRRANQRAADLNLPNVTHQVATAAALPFTTGEFDAARGERLLQHLPNASTAVAEMTRVIKREGRISLVETDWGSLSVSVPPSLVDVERRITRGIAEVISPNGFVGRNLLSLLTQHGVTDITVRSNSLSTTDPGLLRFLAQLDLAEQRLLQIGLVSNAEVDSWRRWIDTGGGAGQLFASVTIISAAATIL